MPYIRQDDRERLRPLLIGLSEIIETPGELAYVVTRLMLGYWRRAPSYQRWAEMRGAVADQIDEFRRRVVDEYEDRKRGENGDVF
ncbi:MAG TPA: hypothetical protein VF200_00715 [Woeseiaceae bacterium]